MPVETEGVGLQIRVQLAVGPQLGPHLRPRTLPLYCVFKGKGSCAGAASAYHQLKDSCYRQGVNPDRFPEKTVTTNCLNAGRKAYQIKG